MVLTEYWCISFEMSVSTHHLHALLVMCWFIFWRDNLAVGGRQMVSLVHGWGSLFAIYSHIASFTFLMCQLDSRVSTLVLSMDTKCPVARQWSPTPVGLSRFVFFEPLAEWSLSFQIIPPKSEPTHLTPVRDQDLTMIGSNVRFKRYAPK